jgi:hypothetical protein
VCKGLRRPCGPRSASTAASSPASHGQPRAPPPPSPLGAEALGVVGVVGVEAAVTVTEAVLVAWCAASSVTVRLTVKLPAAVVATVAVHWWHW